MKVALIACTKKKKNYKCQAKELYSESALFSYAYNYAKKHADKVFILSAKHGLVDENEVLEPYNQTLNGAKNTVKKSWAEKVFKQMEEKIDLNDAELIFLAGQNYRKFLIPMIKTKYDAKISVPLEDVGGIGKQLHYLKEEQEEQEEYRNL